MSESTVKKTKRKVLRRAERKEGSAQAEIAREAVIAELQRRTRVKETFDQIDVLRRRTKLPKGITVRMLIVEGRK